MALHLHPFASEDQLGLVDAIDAVCGEGRWMRTTRFEPTPLWAHSLQEPVCRHHWLQVAEDERRIVGWCRIFPETDRGEPREATLGVGLLPAYRDQGIGTTMVRRSLSWAKSVGYRRVLLTTYAHNARAIHVFARCGFAFTGQVYGRSLEMACELPGVPNAQGESDGESCLD